PPPTVVQAMSDWASGDDSIILSLFDKLLHNIFPPLVQALSCMPKPLEEEELAQRPPGRFGTLIARRPG
ncbi:MAG: hypothetical protein ACREA0_04350, partial [bacterium]